MGKHESEWTEAEVEAQLSPKKRKTKSGDAAATAATVSGSAGNQSPDINIHPWDSTVNLSVHAPLFPPGRILHVVRHYPRPIVVEER